MELLELNKNNNNNNDILKQMKKYEYIVDYLKTTNYNFNYKPIISKSLIKFFKLIYKQIKQSYLEVIKIKLNKKVINNNYKLKTNKFISKNIVNSINNTVKEYYNFSCKLNDLNVNINYAKLQSDYNIEKIKNDIYNILACLYLIKSFCKKSDFNNINIYLYKTKFSKHLPQNNVKILDCEHVNSGYTLLGNSYRDLIIYREEEWFKVFIHECFHAFKLDFNGELSKEASDKINKIIPIKNTIKIEEAYSETWAKILNCCIYSYTTTHNVKKFIKTCVLILKYEIYYSIIQMNKVLLYNNIIYDYINDNKTNKINLSTYIEKSNVFSYYVISTILLFNYREFIKLTLENNETICNFNKTTENIDNLVSFIERKISKKRFIKIIHLFQNHHIIFNNNALSMSLVEL